MSVYIPVDLQRQIRAHFNNRCAYYQTIESLTVTTFEFEHISPRAANGQTTFANLCLACPSCNRHKASRQNAIDPMSQQETSLFHPQQQVWIEHFAWNERATEIIGLTPTGRATISALKMNRSQLTRVRELWVRLGEHPPKT